MNEVWSIPVAIRRFWQQPTCPPRKNIWEEVSTTLWSGWHQHCSAGSFLQNYRIRLERSDGNYKSSRALQELKHLIEILKGTFQKQWIRLKMTYCQVLKNWPGVLIGLVPGLIKTYAIFSPECNSGKLSLSLGLYLTSQTPSLWLEYIAVRLKTVISPTQSAVRGNRSLCSERPDKFFTLF